MSSLLKYSTLFLILILFRYENVFSQNAIQNFEQITIATDRSLYISGEPIWFSASYTVPSDTSVLLSKVLYIELFSNDNQLVVSQKINIAKGVINGQIIIPEQANTGYYILRAYTRYQENFPVWQMTSVIISVVNPAHPLSSGVLPAKEELISAATMPDGNIAFQIKESLIKEVKTVELYVNEQPVGTEIIYYSNGLGKVNYKKAKDNEVQLMVHLNSGDTLLSHSLHLNTIPIELITSRKSDEIELTLSVKTKTKLTDSLVVAGEHFSVDLSEIDPWAYPLAIALVLEGTNNNELSLLPGYLIDNPLYIDSYVTMNQLHSDDITDQINIAFALASENLLQLVQTQPHNQNFEVPEINGLTLQGKLINPINKQPLNYKLLYCSVLGDQPQFHAVSSAEDGSFVIPLNFLFNQQDVYLGTNSYEEAEPEIIINNGFCPTPPIWFPSPFLPDTTYEEMITSLYFNYQVNKIFNIRRKQILGSPITVRPAFGNNLKQIVLADYIQMSSTQEVFNELVPFVRAQKKDDYYKLIVFDEQLNLKYDNPLVLVDHLPFFDIDKLMELQPTEIEKIEVSTHVYAYGNQMFNGVIMITTNTGNFAGLPHSKGGVFVEYNTLEPDIQFIPFLLIPTKSDKPNFANTAFWKSINYDDKTKHLLVSAPDNIDDYELLIISLQNEAKIIGRQRVKVSNALPEN
ncbi:MAG: hypothetical protein H8E34_05100 [Bacteroidetes bacterium]|nr:hypothetical protein [Bacteroidota bacterium]MBL6944934.1 hypothetical protein [Bacteroidales bacterium]